MSNFKYEVERLNKTVNELRGKLFESEAENQKLKLELECVLELLKKAWAGDRIASMHITNILNNAEVTNLKQHSGTGTVDPSAARQAIMDKQQRETILRSRNEYLNQEFIKTVTTMGGMPVSCNSSTTMSRPSTSVLRRPMSTGGRPGSSRALGAARRAQSAVGGDRPATAGAPGPNIGARFEMIQANERLELFGLRPSNTSVRYDDPSRYMKDGLFSPDKPAPDLKVTGKPGSLMTVPFIYASQGLHATGSPRVQAAQIIAARRQGRTPQQIASLVQGAGKRPPSGVLAVQDRPLKNEVQYYESSLQPNRPKSGQPRDPPASANSDSTRARPKSSTTRGIRFADDVDILPPEKESIQDDTSGLDSQRTLTPSEDRKRRTTVAIQRRIGISDNAIVVPR